MMLMLMSMFFAMIGVVVGSAGLSAASPLLLGIGGIFILGGFGTFGYIAFYIRLVKFAMQDFYNLLVRITYGKKYFLTFSIADINRIDDKELLSQITEAVPSFANTFFKEYQVFIAHHQYTTEGDVILLCSDSPRAISDPQPVEMLLGGWIVKTKVAELTGLELTHILKPVRRQLTFMEKLMTRLGRPLSGHKMMEWDSIPIVFIYDSDITPDIMKSQLFGIPNFAKDPVEAQKILEAVNKAAVVTMSTPYEQRERAYTDHIEQLNRVIDEEKLPFAFETSEPTVTTPSEKRNDSLGKIVKIAIVLAVIGLGIWFLSSLSNNSANMAYYQQQQQNAYHPPSTGVTSYNLTISIRGQGTTIPVAGSTQFTPNSNVGLTATAATGWQFVKWCAVANLQSQACLAEYQQPNVQIQVNQNLILVAIFQQIGGSSTTSSTTSTSTSISITTTTKTGGP